MTRWTKGTLDHDGDGRMGGSLPTNQEKENTSMAKEQKIVTVTLNGTYENNETKDRVVVFHAPTGGLVRYAPVGINSGREYRMELQEFLDTFTEVDTVKEAGKQPNAE